MMILSKSLDLQLVDPKDFANESSPPFFFYLNQFEPVLLPFRTEKRLVNTRVFQWQIEASPI